MNSSGNISTRLKKLSDSEGYMKVSLCEMLIALLGLLKLCSVLDFTSNPGDFVHESQLHLGQELVFTLTAPLFFVVRKLQREPEQYNVLTEKPSSNQIESIYSSCRSAYKLKRQSTSKSTAVTHHASRFVD